jgi:hypothetical protein
MSNYQPMNLGPRVQIPPHPTTKARLLSVAIGAGSVALSVWLGGQVLDHAKNPVYLIPTAGKVAVMVAMIAVLTSAVASVFLTRGWVIFVVGAAISVIFLGVLLTLFGIPLLAVGAGLGALAYKLVSKVSAKQRLAVFALGGITALAVALLFMAWNHPPLVECSAGGASVTPTYWFWGGSPSSSSGSGHTTPDGTSSGSGSFDGKTYSYVCRGEELLDFKISG